MCGCGYFGTSVCPTTGIHGQSVSSFTSSKINNTGYSVLSRTKNVNAKEIRHAMKLYRPIKWLVASKIETENQRSLSMGTTRNGQPVSGHPHPQLHVRLHQSADMQKACGHVRGCVCTSISGHLLPPTSVTHHKGSVC